MSPPQGDGEAPDAGAGGGGIMHLLLAALEDRDPRLDRASAVRVLGRVAFSLRDSTSGPAAESGGTARLPSASSSTAWRRATLSCSALSASA